VGWTWARQEVIVGYPRPNIKGRNQREVDIMFRLTKARKEGIEKITGKRWDSWKREEVEAYYSYTEQGIEPIMMSEGLRELMMAHRQHPVVVEMWKRDFACGLLSFEDFFDREYPEAYRRHIAEVYFSVFDRYTPPEKLIKEMT